MTNEIFVILDTIPTEHFSMRTKNVQSSPSISRDGEVFKELYNRLQHIAQSIVAIFFSFSPKLSHRCYVHQFKRKIFIGNVTRSGELALRFYERR